MNAYTIFSICPNGRNAKERALLAHMNATVTDAEIAQWEIEFAELRKADAIARDAHNLAVETARAERKTKNKLMRALRINPLSSRDSKERGALHH